MIVETFRQIALNNIDVIKQKIQDVAEKHVLSKNYKTITFNLIESKYFGSGDEELRWTHEPNLNSPLRNIEELVDELKRIDLYDVWTDTAVFVIPSKETRVPIHIDYQHYKYSILIPILNCEDTFTAFFREVKPVIRTRVKASVSNLPYYVYKPEQLRHLKKIDQVQLTDPIIFNHGCPHQVICDSNAKYPRITASLRFTSDEKVMEFLSKYENTL